MTQLEQLLIRVRDGELDESFLVEVRQALHAEVRLPEELRDTSDFDEDPVGTAEALLAVLGHEPDWLGDLLTEALRGEAGPGTGASAVEGSISQVIDAEALRAQERAGLPPVADAVRAEAGRVELALSVLGVIGGAHAPLREAVVAEAGQVDVAAAAVTRIGLVPLPVGQAVVAEAGPWHVQADPSFPLREAIASEAGCIEVSGPWVSEPLGLREAIAAEAGGIQVTGPWRSVAQGLREAIAAEAGGIQVTGPWAAETAPLRQAIAVEAGSIELDGPWEALPLAEAVRLEAGSVDVVGGVLARIESSLAPELIPELPAANRGRFWTYAGLTLAAVAMLALVIGRLMPLGGVGLVDLPDFARLSEVQVEDLSYGQKANAAVIPFEDDEGNGVLVIWVEEESGA